MSTIGRWELLPEPRHRARNAPATSRRTAAAPCPWRRRTNAPDRARQIARGPITLARRETTQTATPTKRPDPGKEEHQQATFRPSPGKKKKHRQATFGPPGGKSPLGQFEETQFQTTNTAKKQKNKKKVGFRARETQFQTRNTAKKRRKTKTNRFPSSD